MYNIEHKTSFYSLGQCKEYIRNMAQNINNAENEGILASAFHYLEEYEKKIRKEYITKLPSLFKVKYISDMMFWDGTTKNQTYEVIEELKDQYVIKNDFGDVSTLQKDKFVIIKSLKDIRKKGIN